MGLGTVGLLLATGYAAARGIPNRFERRYRRQIKDLGKQLARGEGGMSDTEKQQALGQAAQTIDSATAQQEAKLARGAATGMAASGMQQQALRDLSQGRQRAMSQAQSNILQQDIQLRDAMKRQYMAGMRDLATRTEKQKQRALDASKEIAPFVREQAQIMGAQRRGELGSATTSAAQDF
jgi:hypothetical protein